MAFSLSSMRVYLNERLQVARETTDAQEQSKRGATECEGGLGTHCSCVSALMVPPKDAAAGKECDVAQVRKARGSLACRYNVVRVATRYFGDGHHAASFDGVEGA